MTAWATVAAGLGAALLPLAAVPPTAEAVTRPVVTWSASSVRAGKEVVATVEPRSLPRGTTAVLLRKFPDAWRVADGSAERTRAGLKLSVPTDQYGRFTYRVAARNRGGTVSVSDTRRVRVRPTYDPRGRERHYEFLYERRTRWESCRSVRWKFNDDRAPRRGLKQVKAAVRRIHAATGLELVYAGRTERAANPYGDHIAGAAIVVGWRSARTFRRYVGNPNVVGLAGQRFEAGYRDAEGAVYRTTQAGVILNAAHRLDSGFGKGVTWGEVIVHELGHVIGLNHTSSSTQVMYFSTTGHDANLGAGDLNGLRQLGDTRGCLQRTSARATQGSALSR